ncbi:MAG: pyrroline-5-carboxylate reductase [Bdellovibrionales bacterium]
MSHHNFFNKAKIGFIGAGNMGQAIIRGLLAGGMDPQRICATAKTKRKLDYLESKYGIRTLKNNEEVVDICDVIILAVKPQDLYEVIEPIAKSFSDDKIVISLAAGIPLVNLKKWLLDVNKIIRLMPNTPVNLGKGLIGYCMSEAAEYLSSDLEHFLSPLGEVIFADEDDPFQALTVGCGSGVGFVFEIMIYWQEWLEEHGFSAVDARKMVVQTFLGASELAKSQEQTTIEELQRKVVSKKGVTHAGLNSMRELEMERALRVSFEKAVLRDKELGRT